METSDGGHLDAVILILQRGGQTVHQRLRVDDPLPDILVIGAEAGEHLEGGPLHLLAVGRPHLQLLVEPGELGAGHPRHGPHVGVIPEEVGHRAHQVVRDGGRPLEVSIDLCRDSINDTIIMWLRLCNHSV